MPIKIEILPNTDSDELEGFFRRLDGWTVTVDEHGDDLLELVEVDIMGVDVITDEHSVERPRVVFADQDGSHSYFVLAEHIRTFTIL